MVDNTEEEGGESGTDKGGKGKGGKGGSILYPSYDELIAVIPEESELATLAKIAVERGRRSLKEMGEKVEALDRMHEIRRRLSDPRLANEIGGGGSNLEEHPLLANLGGAFDDIVFPESEIDAAARNDPELKNELKNRLGMGMSAQAIQYDLEKKNKEKLTAKARPEPEPKLEYVFRPVDAPALPRPRPLGF